MARHKRSLPERELAALRHLSIMLRRFVKTHGKPTQWYDPFRKAAQLAEDERSLLERALNGDQEAIHLRRLMRNEAAESE